MLISGSQNASIGNKAFIVKLEEYKKNPILNQQAEIKDFLVTNEIEWKQANIQKRLDKILKFAIERWDFSSVK